MRTLDVNSLNLGDASAASVTGTALNVSMCKSISCKGVAVGTLTGTLKLQGSNDPTGGIFPLTPSNWVDISGKTVSVTAAGTFDIPTFDNTSNWVRAVYTKLTSTGSPTITAEIHAIGD